MGYFTIENHPRRKWIIRELGKVGTSGVTFTSICAALGCEISPSTLSRYRREVMPQLISKSERARVVGVEAEIGRVEVADYLAELATERISKQAKEGAENINPREALALMDQLQKGGRWRGTLGRWWSDVIDVNDQSSVSAIRALVADTVVALGPYPDALDAFRQVVDAHHLAPAAADTPSPLPAPTDSDEPSIPSNSAEASRRMPDW